MTGVKIILMVVKAEIIVKTMINITIIKEIFFFLFFFIH